VSLPEPISIPAAHAQPCIFALPSDSAVGIQIIAITGTLLYATIRISGSPNFHRSSTSFVRTIFFSIITVSLHPESE